MWNWFHKIACKRKNKMWTRVHKTFRRQNKKPTRVGKMWRRFHKKRKSIFSFRAKSEQLIPCFNFVTKRPNLGRLVYHIIINALNKVFLVVVETLPRRSLGLPWSVLYILAYNNYNYTLQFCTKIMWDKTPQKCSIFKVRCGGTYMLHFFSGNMLHYFSENGCTIAKAAIFKNVPCCTKG